MSDYPKDWEEVKLGDIPIQIKKGDLITKKERANGNIPVIAGGKSPAYYCNRYNREGTTITVSASGANAGYVNLFYGQIFASDCSTIKEDCSYCIEYIYYLMAKEQENIYKLQTGGAQPHVHPKDIEKLEVIYSRNIEEQKAIADTLMTFDKHIENLEKLIEKKKMIRDGAVEDLMTGKTRLDGFDGEWEEVSLGDSVSIVRGASPRPIEKHLTLDVDGINWIKIGDAPKNGKYIKKTEEKIKKDSAIFSVLVNPGDFILSNSMSYGRPYIVKNRGCIHDGWLKLFGFDKELDNDYLFYLLSLDNIQSQYRSLAAGSGVKNLNKEIVKKVKIQIPTDIKEQRAIASILTSMDEEIQDLEKEKEKIEKIKAGAMDDLLTGRVRLV